MGLKNEIPLFIVLYFLALKVSAQSLIPNGSFEEYIGCPIYEGALDSTKFWLNPTYSVSSTPDYFNSCSSSNTDVPLNYAGYQEAFSGNAYAGIFLKQNGFPEPAREYLESELTQYLQKDSCYVIGLALNLAGQSKYSPDSFEIYFSNTMLLNKSNPFMFSLAPQINFITQLDTLNWTRLSQKYIANGGEKFVVLGNFKNDLNTGSNLVNQAGAIDGIYVYIDSVFLLSCSTFYPIPVIISAQTTLCKGAYAVFSDASYNDPEQWQWYFEGGTPSSFNGKAPPPILYSDTGTFAVQLIVSNSYGSNTLLKPNYIHVVPGPEPVAAETSFQLKEGDIITLEACARGSSYNWQPPVAILQNHDTLLTIQPDQTQNYNCIVATVNGCTTSCQYDVKVQSGLLIPTGFTPNGDGVNDVFRILNTNITLTYFAVYNRWGEKLFETNNIQDGWDGIYQDIPQPIDTYVWQADYIITKTGKRKTAKGNVTLVR